MVGSCRIEDQTVIRVRSIYPRLHQVSDFQSEHAISLFREICKVSCTAIEVTARGGPGVPGYGAFIPTGCHSINIRGLTGLVPVFI